MIVPVKVGDTVRVLGQVCMEVAVLVVVVEPVRVRTSTHNPIVSFFESGFFLPTPGEGGGSHPPTFGSQSRCPPRHPTPPPGRGVGILPIFAKPVPGGGVDLGLKISLLQIQDGPQWGKRNFI